METFLANPLTGLACGILLTIWGTRMSSATSSNTALVTGWVLFVWSVNRVPLLARQPLVPRALYVLVFAGVIGLALYYALWTTTTTVSTNSVPRAPAAPKASTAAPAGEKNVRRYLQADAPSYIAHAQVFSDRPINAPPGRIVVDVTDIPEAQLGDIYEPSTHRFRRPRHTQLDIATRHDLRNAIAEKLADGRLLQQQLIALAAGRVPNVPQHIGPLLDTITQWHMSLIRLLHQRVGSADAAAALVPRPRTDYPRGVQGGHQFADGTGGYSLEASWDILEGGVERLEQLLRDKPELSPID